MELGMQVTYSFEVALDALKHGELIARQGWNGNGMYLYLVPGSSFEVNRPPLLGILDLGTEVTYSSHIDMKTADGSHVPWVASQTDILADDWEIIELEPVPELEAG